MLRRPDVDEVMEYGRALGFDLTPMEARMIQARMMDTIAALETSGEILPIYEKWLQKPIPPKGLNLNFPLSDEMKALFKNPNDKALD